MKALKLITYTIAFALELVMLFYLGFWGYHTDNTTFLKYTLAISLPLLAAVLWGIFAAPKSKTRLANPYRIIFKLALFSATAFLIYQLGYVQIALFFIAVALLNEAAALFLKLGKY